MKALFLIICFSTFCLQGCYKDCKTNNENITSNQVNSLKISSETAEMIAKGWLCLDFNLREYDISMTEKPDFWEFKFSKNDIKTSKFGPSISISKTNGEPISLINTK